MRIKQNGLTVAIALALTVSLTACQSTGYENVPANPALENEEVNVSGSSYLQACLAGGAIGALGTLLFKGNAQDALIAAAAGCAVFMGGNALLDNLRQDYATTEQRLNKLIKTMRENNAKAAKLAAVAEQAYKEDHARMMKTYHDFEKQRITRQELSKSIAYCNSNIELLNDNIAQHEKSLESYQIARDGLSKDAFSKSDIRKIQECDRRIRELENSIEDIRLLSANYVRDRDVLNLAYTESSDSSNRA